MNTVTTQQTQHLPMPTMPPSNNGSGHKAVRFIKTKDLDRQDWLTARKQGIGASDASAAVGLNPYKSQLELWLEKTGRMSEQAITQEQEDTSPMYWGTVLEEIVAKHYQKRTGHKVRRVNAILQHPEHAFMLANLDREIVGSDQVQILECKTAGFFGAKYWSEGVPEYIQIQVQHQLAVTGKQSADVAVLVAGQEFRIYHLQRDDDLIHNLIQLEAEFWRYVEDDVPPPVDGSASSAMALQLLYPQDQGQTVDFKAIHELSDKFAELIQTRLQLEQTEAKEALLKQQLQQAMGEATKAEFATGSISWKRSKDSWQLDSKRLVKDQPQLLDQYGIAKAGSRRFIVNID